MRKEKKIQRRFLVTECKILACNLADRTTFDDVVRVPGKFDSMEKLNSCINKIYNNSEHVFCSLIEAQIKKPLYEIPVSKFLANAEEISE